MRFQVEHGDDRRQIEIRETGSEGTFDLLVQSDGESPVSWSVRVLSRTGERWTLEVDGRVEDVLLSEQGGSVWADWRNQTFPVSVRDQRELLSRLTSDAEIAGAATLKAQMPGKIVAVLKQADEKVEVGDGLVIIESMKMQNELKSPKSGRVAVCKVVAGENVNAGDLLFRIE